jgi:hypothetical protein
MVFIYIELRATKMADPRDDYNEAMMDLINSGGGSQYGPNQNEVGPDFNDDGSQYLVFDDPQDNLPEQENVGDVYLLKILHLLYI